MRRAPSRRRCQIRHCTTSFRTYFARVLPSINPRGCGQAMSKKQRSKHHKTAAKRHIEPAPGRSPRPSRATEPERLYNHPRIVPYARLDEPPAANELASDGTASACAVSPLTPTSSRTWSSMRKAGWGKCCSWSTPGSCLYQNSASSKRSCTTGARSGKNPLSFRNRRHRALRSGGCARSTTSAASRRSTARGASWSRMRSNRGRVGH